jgi:hypothetical protein
MSEGSEREQKTRRQTNERGHVPFEVRCKRRNTWMCAARRRKENDTKEEGGKQTGKEIRRTKEKSEKMKN